MSGSVDMAGTQPKVDHSAIAARPIQFECSPTQRFHPTGAPRFLLPSYPRCLNLSYLLSACRIPESAGATTCMLNESLLVVVGMPPAKQTLFGAPAMVRPPVASRMKWI